MTAERDLRLAETRLRSLWDLHPDAVFSLDLEGRFVSVNPAAFEISGRGADELIGHSFVDLLLDEDVEEVAGHFAGMLGGETRIFETRYVRGDGSVGDLEVIGIPIVVDDEMIEVYGIAEDITARRHLERTLAESRRVAESANAAKSAFLATMSHEIRTPLTSVLAAAELLDETTLTDRQRKLVTVMERSGERLLRLVNDVLDFSRVEAGRVELVAAPFDLHDVVDDTALIVRGALDERGLDFVTEVGPDVPRRVVGDAARIAQVLTNLIDNATKFTHVGGVGLAVEAEREGPDTVELRFTVTDTGIGMTEEVQGQVFEMFRQADSSITREFGGTGLGLAISRNLVALMGGVLEVSSAPGRGSAFTFAVPLARTAGS
ncbi:ATP-binding protein [Nocardioides sp. 1609]|uniref:sensor histidine kinase n=1 Tax=Nocardioides sp. 1609 TaxID=2508327 RepID=UPI00106F3E50|nr:ATP-binding protein [Nocardioides sp. 1609]